MFAEVWTGQSCQREGRPCAAGKRTTSPLPSRTPTTPQSDPRSNPQLKLFRQKEAASP